MIDPTYVHLTPGAPPPRLEASGPFKAVVIIEDDVTPEWQDTVSDWLVNSGCRYMLAWGRKCSEWDDSVDHANLRCFGYDEIPPDDFVMTSWHERDALEDTFWMALHAAPHPSLELQQTYIIHIAPSSRSAEITLRFREAKSE